MTSTPIPPNEIHDSEIRDWLLRRLDAERGAALERQLFVEAAFADRIDAVERDLIDDCARGHLSGAEARIVRARDSWRVRFAEALAELQRADDTSAPIRPRAPAARRVGIGVALAASLLLAVVALRWPTIAPKRPVPITTLPTMTLLAEQRRGSAAPLELPPRRGDMRLQAEIGGMAEDASARYTLEVSGAAGVLFVAHDLVPRTAGGYHFVEVALPATVLDADPRRVAVSREGARDSAVESWDVRMPRSP